MKLAIGSDHGGFALKEAIVRHLKKHRVAVKDFGIFTPDPVDYPDIAKKVSKAVARKSFKFGILVCGTGLGMAITANKVRGIRAVTVHNVFTAKMSRAHNDANVLTLGGRVLDNRSALKIVDTFLATPFEGGRHLRRVRKIEK
jgi:ribose 5-phosphate isomerase B